MKQAEFKNRVEIVDDITIDVNIFINSRMVRTVPNSTVPAARRFVANLLKVSNGKWIYVIDKTWKNGTVEKYKLFSDGSKKYF